MKKSRMAIWGMVVMACLLVSACRTAPDVVRVKMDYTPTNVVPPPKSFPDTPIFIGSFEDKRKTPDQIGQNSENPKLVPVKVETAEVVSFMRTAVTREFKRANLNVVDSESAAKRIVNASLLNLWVEEKSTFNGSIVAEVTVRDKSGKNLYHENIRALATRWGSSYSESEYRKVLSDTIVELIKNLFSNDAFLNSLK
jgi:hypothetical protein